MLISVRAVLTCLSLLAFFFSQSEPKLLRLVSMQIKNYDGVLFYSY